MRTKIIITAACALLIASLGLRHHAVVDRRRIEEAMAAAGAERRVLEAQLESVKRRVAAAEQRRMAMHRAPDIATGNRPAGGPAAPPSPPPPTSQRALIATDPQLEALQLRWARKLVTLEYGPLFHAMGLTAQQVERIEDLFMKFQERSMDLFGAELALDAGSKQTAAQLKQQAKEEHEAALASLLGPEHYHRFQEFHRTLPLRNGIVFSLAGAAALEGYPLSSEQAEHLMEAAMDAGARASPKQGGELAQVIDWNAVDARARQILSPAQFELFKNVAAPSGFKARSHYDLEAAISRALEADGASHLAPQERPGG